MDRLSDKWVGRFLQLADHVSTWSKDPSTKVGAVIVDNIGRVVSMGYNGFPRNVNDPESLYHDRDYKHLMVCHAERNALDQAPTRVDGCVLFSTLLPCNECAKSIIQCGISKVYTYEVERPDNFRWDITKEIFDASGVSYYFFNRGNIDA